MNDPEPTPDQDLSDVMKQIEAMDADILKAKQSQALSGSEAVVQTATLPNAHAVIEAQAHTPAPDVQPAPSTPVPAQPQPPRGTPNVFGDAKTHDVVQVNDTDSQHHGVIFTIGEIKEGWVHGYRLTDHGGKDFITVKIPEVHRIGPAKVRSQVPCSRQWLEQREREK